MDIRETMIGPLVVGAGLLFLSIALWDAFSTVVLPMSPTSRRGFRFVVDPAPEEPCCKNPAPRVPGAAGRVGR